MHGVSEQSGFLREEPDPGFGLGRLLVSGEITNQTVSQAGSLFVEGIRNEIELTFSRDQGAEAVTHLIDKGSVNGTATHDPTEGQVVFAVPATPGSRCYFESDRTLQYEPGHMMRGGQTIQVSAQPTGTGKVEWGFGESNGSGGLLNAVGWGYDATGLYAFRMKAGVYVHKVYSDSFTHDPVDGSPSSLYRESGSPVALSPLFNNIYEQGFEWYGIASPTFLVLTPSGDPLKVHVDQTAGRQTGTSVPEPRLPIFLRIQNDGQALQVRSGCWRGGILTNKTVLTGQDPNLSYADVRVGGVLTNSPAPSPLGAGGTYTSDWYACAGYTSLSIVVATDQLSAGDGIALQFSDDASTVRREVLRTFNPADVTVGSKLMAVPPSLDYFRLVYTNGATPQAGLFIQLALHTTEVQDAIDAVEADMHSSSVASMTRSVLAASNGSAYANIGRGSSGGLDVGIVQHEVETPIKALASLGVNQSNVATTAALIISPTANRRSLSIRALTANGQKVYIGPTSAVSVGSGYELAAGAALDIDLDETQSIYMISNSGTQRVCWAEVLK